MIKIVNVGVQATLTDPGRKFAQCSGYSQSGAIDWFSYTLANALCKNELDTPALEIMAGSFSMQVTSQYFVAVTGADCELFVNKKPVDPNKVLHLQTGDTLTIGQLKNGLYNYIAFQAANFKNTLELFKSSVCATSREKAGGLHKDGTSLKRGDAINVELETDTGLKMNERSLSYFSLTTSLNRALENLIQETKKSVIPVIFSYQADKFEWLQRMKLLSSKYKTTANMNQMGVRLEGPEIAYPSSTLTSQPIAYGAIQIPKNGKPIIMRNERQTIGGYPIIGVVSRLGLARLSQVAPNSLIKFEEISQENALCQYRMTVNFLERLCSR